MTAIIDTCVLIWLTDQHEKLTSAASEAVDTAESLYVSAISAFEIALKHADGQLNLPRPPASFYADALLRCRITELAITGEIALAAPLLPCIHRDPADRFIVATALKHNLAIVTPDKFIPQYPGVKVIW